VLRAEKQPAGEAALWLLRGALGALVAAVGLWLIPDKSSASWVVGIGVIVLIAGGVVAGWRGAWLWTPVGVWLFLGGYQATDCSDCRGGGEEVISPATWLLFLTVAAALVGTIGGTASAWFWPRVSIKVLVLALVLVGLVFASLIAFHWAHRESHGRVLVESQGVRYRAGNALHRPEDAIQRAARAAGIDQPVWLGPEVSGFALSAIQVGPDSLLLVYGDCGPAPCAAPVTVGLRRTCGTPPELSYVGRAPAVRDGVYFVEDPAGATVPGGKKVVWPGHTAVTIYNQFPSPGRVGDVLPLVSRIDGKPLEPANPYC
jgi:hypothetical protein